MTDTHNHIKAAQPTIFDYQLAMPIKFSPRLNLISGPNGTMKSNFLLKLRDDPSREFSIEGEQPRIQAISPRRNIETQNVEVALQQFAANKNYEEKLYNARSIVLSGFEGYPSLADLYSTAYASRRRKGGDQKKAMEEATDDLNSVVRRILKNYKLQSVWDEGGGGFPILSILKNGTVPVPLDGLSAGEREALNLALYLYTIRDRYDVYLIDEPEVHLNWSLEEDLFAFLDWYVSEYGKQVIAVTHSRVVFESQYSDSCIFMDWDDSNQWTWNKKPSEEMLNKLAGSTVRLLRVAHSDAIHIYVEDAVQAIVIKDLTNHISTPLNIVDLGGRGRVEGLFRSMEANNDPQTRFFVIDGDNVVSKISSPSFIQLPRYCMENFLVDANICSAITGKTESGVQEKLCSLIKSRKPPSNKHYEFFRPILSNLENSQLPGSIIEKFDISEVFPSFLKFVEMDKKTYIAAYIDEVRKSNRVLEIFGEQVKSMLAAVEDA